MKYSLFVKNKKLKFFTLATAFLLTGLLWGCNEDQTARSLNDNTAVDANDVVAQTGSHAESGAAAAGTIGTAEQQPIKNRPIFSIHSDISYDLSEGLPLHEAVAYLRGQPTEPLVSTHVELRNDFVVEYDNPYIYEDTYDYRDLYRYDYNYGGCIRLANMLS